MTGRRAILVGIGSLAVGSIASRAWPRQIATGTLAALSHSRQPATTSVVRVADRDYSIWRRTNPRADLPNALTFRSLDRFDPNGKLDLQNGGWWAIDEAVLRSAHAGALSGTDHDSSREIQAILCAAAVLKRPVDDGGTQYLVENSVVLPSGVTWLGANLQAGTSKMNVVLIGSNTQLLDFTIRGTGVKSPPGAVESKAIERAVYPMANGLRNARIRGRISNLTVGVHLQPVEPRGARPSNCSIDVTLVDIVGQPGASEGYGVLLSPADNCSVKVHARNIQRHAVYLSAGASFNSVEADVESCLQDAVTIYSLASQPACVGNQIDVRAIGVRVQSEAVVSYPSACFSIYGKANENVARVIAAGGVKSTSAPHAAAVICGLEGLDGPFPVRNKLTVDATGTFSGPYVVDVKDAAETLIEGGDIRAHGSVGIIGISDTRNNTKSFPIGGTVSDVKIDGGNSQAIGIVIATERSPVLVRENVHFSNIRKDIMDFTGKLRRS